MGNASGFTWTIRKNGELVISHHGQAATILRAGKVESFLSDIDGVSDQDQQDLMARLTGNYRRGNERQAKNHPRNR